MTELVQWLGEETGHDKSLPGAAKKEPGVGHRWSATDLGRCTQRLWPDVTLGQRMTCADNATNRSSTDHPPGRAAGAPRGTRTETRSTPFAPAVPRGKRRRYSCHPDSSLSACLTICSAGGLLQPRLPAGGQRWGQYNQLLPALAASQLRVADERWHAPFDALARVILPRFRVPVATTAPRPASAGNIGRPTLGPIAGIEVTGGRKRWRLRCEGSRPSQLSARRSRPPTRTAFFYRREPSA